MKMIPYQQHQQQQQQQQQIISQLPPSSNGTTYEEIENGIDFILSHLKEPIIFPRKISTQKSEHKQFEVKDKEGIIKSFKYSNFIDCKINAFPILKENYTKWTPNLLFIDLDFKILNLKKP